MSASEVPEAHTPTGGDLDRSQLERPMCDALGMNGGQCGERVLSDSPTQASRHAPLVIMIRLLLGGDLVEATGVHADDHGVTR